MGMANCRNVNAECESECDLCVSVGSTVTRTSRKSTRLTSLAVSIALRGADKHISNFGKYTIARLINGSLKQNVDRNA